MPWTELEDHRLTHSMLILNPYGAGSDLLKQMLAQTLACMLFFGDQHEWEWGGSRVGQRQYRPNKSWATGSSGPSEKTWPVRGSALDWNGWVFISSMWLVIACGPPREGCLCLQKSSFLKLWWTLEELTAGDESFQVLYSLLNTKYCSRHWENSQQNGQQSSNKSRHYSGRWECNLKNISMNVYHLVISAMRHHDQEKVVTVEEEAEGGGEMELLSSSGWSGKPV